MADWVVYMLRCRDDSLYTGVTSNFPRRLDEHRQGGVKGAKYTRGRGPFKVIFRESVPDRSAALKLERHIKSLSKNEKEKAAAKKGEDFRRGRDSNPR